MSDFGSANYGKGGFKKKNYFDMREGTVIARILPPFGELAEKGVWSKYVEQHFGYRNMDGKLRTFASTQVKNHKTKMIEVPDAALDRITDLKAKLEKSRMEMTGPLTAKLNQLVGDKGMYNLDKNHHMNVITLDGRIGTLKIRHKMKLALDIEIDKLRAEGVDPLSIENGRFFVFTRTLGGAGGRDTSFKVSVHKEKIDVPGVGKVERDMVHELTPELQRRCKTEASNLNKLVQYITADEVAQIVAESDLMTGKSPACNRIFDDRWKAEKEARSGTQTQTTTATAAITAAVAPPTEDDDGPGADYVEPAVITPVAASQAAKTTVVTPVTPKATVTPAAKPVSAPAAAMEEMSDADFFKMISAN